MFISIIDQFGTFFLILLGVIVLLTVGYVILSKPRRVKSEPKAQNNKPIENKKPLETNKTKVTNDIDQLIKPEQQPIITNKKDLEDKKVIKAPEVKKTQEKKEFTLEPEEFENRQAMEDVVVEPEQKKDVEKTKTKEPIDDFRRIDEVIESERKQKGIEDEEVAPQNNEEVNDFETLKKNDEKIEDLINQTSSEETKELGKYHVLYRKEDASWYIKREGSEKITKVLPTQKEAIAFATIKAINQKTSVVIHKRDGKIRKQSY